jgi:predicted NACHT family NTPase
MFDRETYLRALAQYAGQVWVPAPEGSAAIHLEDVFVEPRLVGSVAELRTQQSQGKQQPTEPRPLGGTQTTSDLEPALQVVKRALKIAVLGEPGQGKSVLLLQYARLLARQPENERFPLLVELGRKRDRVAAVSDAHEWLFERIPDKVKPALSNDGWKSVCAIIAAGEASILLDGYDEINDEARQQLQELLLTDTFGRNQVVITSRPHA